MRENVICARLAVMRETADVEVICAAARVLRGA
jgi:hypothetical protein